MFTSAVRSPISVQLAILVCEKQKCWEFPLGFAEAVKTSPLPPAVCVSSMTRKLLRTLFHQKHNFGVTVPWASALTPAEQQAESGDGGIL